MGIKLSGNDMSLLENTVVQSGERAIGKSGLRHHVLSGERIKGSHWNGHRFPPPPAGCVLYLPGYPAQGSTIKDFSGQGNDGTITGATWVREKSGIWGNSFNGTSDLITIAHSASLNFTELSYVTWFKFASLASNPSVINKKETTYDQANGWHLYWDTATAKWGFRIGIQNPTSDVVSVSTGIWYCVGVSVKGGGDITFYHNGQPVGTTGSVASFVDNTDEIRISKQADDYPGWFSGKNGVLATLVNVESSAVKFANFYNQSRHLLGV